MDDPNARARARDAEDRELFAIRRAERKLAAEERRLEDQLSALTINIHNVEREIEAEWRREHWGREPERPPSWRAGEAGPPAPAESHDG